MLQSDVRINEEDEQDEGNQGFADASTYGRSRLHQMPRAREDGTGEEMRNALFGKRLGRRTVHLHGLAPSGDAAFEAVEEVGREAFLPGEQGAQDHEDAFLEFLSGNIDDAGAEVRSLDQRDRKVGHFGDWLKRVGHGEYIKCARKHPLKPSSCLGKRRSPRNAFITPHAKCR